MGGAILCMGMPYILGYWFGGIYILEELSVVLATEQVRSRGKGAHTPGATHIAVIAP